MSSQHPLEQQIDALARENQAMRAELARYQKRAEVAQRRGTRHIAKWQMRCARTLEACQRRQRPTIDEPATETVQSSTCERTWNTDTFTYKNASNDL